MKIAVRFRKRLELLARSRGFLLGLLPGLVLFGCFYLSVTPRSPVTLLDMREVNGLAYRGGLLRLQFTVIRTADCEARVQRRLWRYFQDENGELVPDGDGWVKEIIMLDGSEKNPPTPLGRETTYQLLIPVPSTVAPGTWYYASRTYDGCQFGSSLFGETVRDSPSSPVEIVDPSPGQAPQLVAPGPVTVIPGTAVER